MALPPTIPTSFVPHPGSAAPRRFRGDLFGAFGFFGYAALGIALALALGVFSYGRILAGSKAAKDAELAKAQAAVDPVTIETFVRLRDRLVAGEALLEKHVAFSAFFALLEKLLPGSVRFTTMNIAMNDAGVSKVEAGGVAKSFNALAAASNAFAADGRIKDAIFSDLRVNRNNSVSFTLSATLDPKVIAFSPL